MGEPKTDEEIDVFVKNADTNGDGQVDYDEFCKLMYGSSSPQITHTLSRPSW
jgi:Ca2+-binding EF-hand superfamily protein